MMGLTKLYYTPETGYMNSDLMEYVFIRNAILSGYQSMISIRHSPLAGAYIRSGLRGKALGFRKGIAP